MKKTVGLTISLIWIVLIMASCSAKDAGNAPTKEELDYSAPFSNGKYDPPIPLTVIFPEISTTMSFKDGETIEDNVHTRYVKEHLGIDIKYLWTAADADTYNTRIRLQMAANEPLADVLPMHLSPLNHELIDSGKFMAVDELFEKFASQTWKDAMNEDPSVWYPFMRDGKKYGIPVLDYKMNNDVVLWIRQDWLDQLNMSAPTTMDEVDKLLEAFSAMGDDIYGITFGFNNGLNTNPGNMADSGWVFGAYGTLPFQWIEKEGKVVYGSVQPEAKQGLAKLREWHEKGYFPDDAALWDNFKASDIYVAGKVGIMAAPHWAPIWPLNGLADNAPGAEYRAYPLPLGDDETTMRRGAGSHSGVTLISKEAKNPEAFIIYQSYMFDNYADPKPGSPFEHGIAEGYDWIVVDGKPTNTNDAAIFPNKIHAANYTLNFQGARIPSSYMETLAGLHDGGEMTTPLEIRLGTHYGPPVQQAASVVLSQKQFSYLDVFSGAPTPTMVDRLDFLQQMERETFTKIIMGELPLSAFDTFVKDWANGGGEQMTKEVNDWYASTQ